MIIVTGGAGFIGSNIVDALNAKGVTEILAIDRKGKNFRNLADLRISDFMEPNEFGRAIERDTLPARIDAIFHQRACIDTTCVDSACMMENNFTFAKEVLQCVVARDIPLV